MPIAQQKTPSVALKGPQGKPASRPAAKGHPGHKGAKGGALQEKLQKATYSEGRELVKPGQAGQPSVLSAGPKPKAGGQDQLAAATRGTQQTDQTMADGDPFRSQLFNEIVKGGAETKAQLDKADNMHAATLTGVHTPDCMGKGSMTLATGAASGKTVHDAWSMSAQFRAEQKLAPGDSREEQLARAVAMDPAQGGTLLTTTHSVKEKPPAADPIGAKQDNLRSPLQNGASMPQPKRKAIVVGNSDYIDKDPPPDAIPLFTDLPGAKADAVAMAADLDQRGFDVERHENLKEPDLRKAMLGRGQGLKEGDELAIVYTGHGISWGLNGVDSVTSKKTFNTTGVLPHTDIAGEASKAVGGGYHLEMIVDACESDALAREVRKNLESGGGKSATKSIKDNGYQRLPSGERFDALQEVLQSKGQGVESLDPLAYVLEHNSELANR